MISESNSIFIIGNDENQIIKNYKNIEIYTLTQNIITTKLIEKRLEPETIIELIENSSIIKKIYNASILIILSAELLISYLPYQFIYQNTTLINKLEIIILITPILENDTKFDKLFIKNINQALIFGIKFFIIGTMMDNNKNYQNQNFESFLIKLQQKIVIFFIKFKQICFMLHAFFNKKILIFFFFVLE